MIETFDLNTLLTPTMANDKNLSMVVSQEFYGLPLNIYSQATSNFVYYCVTINHFIVALFSLPEVSIIPSLRKLRK